MQHFFLHIKKVSPRILPVVAALVTPSFAFAGGKPVASSINNPLGLTLIVIVIALLLAIGMLAYVLMGGAQVYLQKFKNTLNEGGANKAAMLAVMLLTSSVVFAQDAPAEATTAVATTISGMSKTAFYTLVGIISLELIVIFVLLYNIQRLLGREKRHLVATTATAAGVPVVAAEGFSWKAWWEKVNAFRPQQQEADIDLGHDYDGIRELDNRLPPWWLYGFYITIVIAGIYLWRYHVTHTAPSSTQEFEIAMAKAEEEKAAFLKTAANLVDENTVTLLTEPSAIENGKKTYTTNCAACHGADGGGTVGPNLTDEYWLHGGRVNDIFKTIKYGVQEKGMKSWKDDFSPVQIAELASYIKTLKGSKPATPKEPQGDLFKEEGSVANPSDSIGQKKLASL